MIFMILFVAAGLITIGLFAYAWWDDEFTTGLAYGFLSAVVSAAVLLVAGISLSGIAFALAKDEPPVTYQLAQLGSTDSVTGRSYFLGGGYIDGKRVLNYTTQNTDGGFSLQRADADNSRIYESDTDPKVIVTITVTREGLLVPWDVERNRDYRFEVPPGSVLENYSVGG